MSQSLDALLWCPDVEVGPGRHKQGHHLGVLYVGRYAQRQGQSVRMVLSGHDATRIAEAAREGQPRVLGVSVGSSIWRTNLHLAARACSLAKREAPSIRTVLGGLTPSMFPREVLAMFAGVDCVVVGEGERAFARILAGDRLADIPGVAYRNGDGKICDTARPAPLEELDTIPHALAVESDQTATTELGGLLGNLRYERPSRCASLLTARGCNGRCRFCLNSWYYAPMRERSIGDVAEEVRALHGQGVRFLRVCDANFAATEQRVLAFCEAVAPLRMRWTCWQRADMTSPQAYRAMRRAGCVATTIGVESFDEGIRNREYGKGVSQAKLARAVRGAAEAGLDVAAEIIIGHPAEGRARLMQGLAGARDILSDVDYVNVSFLTLTPHTRLWDRLVGALDSDVQQQLSRRALFWPIPISAVCPEHAGGELEAWSRAYVAGACHRPGYLLRQAVRTLSRRKRVVWFNRRAITAHVLARTVRRGRRRSAEVPHA